MERTWMVFAFIGSLSLTLGTHWLHKKLLLFAMVLFFCVLPAWTPAILFLRYNAPDGSKFTTWWYFALTVLQFSTGVMLVYLYAYYNREMRDREREYELKQVLKVFPPLHDWQCTVQPCGHKIEALKFHELMERVRHPHDTMIRADVLCP